MPEYLVIFIAIFLVVLFLRVANNPGKKDTFAASFESPPVRVKIVGKVSESPQKFGQQASYIIVAKRVKSNGKLGKAEEVSVSRIDFAQMQRDTEVELFFDREGNYAAFRLVRSNIPVKL